MEYWYLTVPILATHAGTVGESPRRKPLILRFMIQFFSVSDVSTTVAPGESVAATAAPDGFTVAGTDFSTVSPQHM